LKMQFAHKVHETSLGENSEEEYDYQSIKELHEYYLAICLTKKNILALNLLIQAILVLFEY